MRPITGVPTFPGAAIDVPLPTTPEGAKRFADSQNARAKKEREIEDREHAKERRELAEIDRKVRAVTPTTTLPDPRRLPGVFPGTTPAPGGPINVFEIYAQRRGAR